MTVQIDTPYLTIEEYSRRTGLTVRAVKDRCASGDLPLKPRSKPGEKYQINNALLMKQALELEY